MGSEGAVLRWVMSQGSALQNLAKVCRICTHLFHSAEYVNALRGWGRGLRDAVGRWYLEHEADKLAYQISIDERLRSAA